MLQEAGNSLSRPRLFGIPAEILDEILEYVPREDLFTLSTTCSALLNILTPRLYPRTLGIDICCAARDWRNKFKYYKECEQGYLDDKGVENILYAPERVLRHVVEFRLIDTPHRNNRGCQKSTHQGLRRPDETLLALTLQKLFVRATGLDTIIIPRNISIRLFFAILDSIPNLRKLEAGIESLPFYRENRNVKPYQSLVDACTSLKLEQLKIKFGDKELILGIFRTIERSSRTLRDLNIAVEFEEHVYFDEELEGSENWKNNSLRLNMRFPSLERLCVQMLSEESVELANYIFYRAKDFKNISSLVLQGGSNTAISVQYILDNGATIKSLQLIGNEDAIDQPYEELEISLILKQIAHIDTLQLALFNSWDMEAVYFHRYTLKRLWLDCHTTSSPCPEKTCSLRNSLFEGQMERYPFTIENWPVLKELSIPYLGTDRLPLHKGLKVLRIEHYFDPKSSATDYEKSLRPYINKLIEIAAPAKPSLEVIVIMADRYKHLKSRPDPFYVCIDYEEGGYVIETRTNLSRLLSKPHWSYLFQEQAVGRMWDDPGIWEDI